MDTVYFQIIHPEPEEGEITWPQIRIVVNGRDLRDMVREIELSERLAEGSPDLAGLYAGLSADLLRSNHLLGQPEGVYTVLERDDRPNRTALLICECGEPGCWPLMATISVTDDHVIWDEFRQPHRKHWKYEGFGPFAFSRLQYDAALRHATSQRGDSPQ